MEWAEMPSTKTLIASVGSTVTEEGLQATNIVPVHYPMSLLILGALHERLDQVTSTPGRGSHQTSAYRGCNCKA